MEKIEKPEIYGRIADAMNDIEAIGKNQQNQMQKFKFRGIDDLYNSLHGILAKNKIFTVIDVLGDNEQQKTTKSGGALIYRTLKIKYTCYTTDGSSISGTVLGEAMDSGDKAANKAMAVAHKYFLTQLFAIPYENMDDPDKDKYELTAKKQNGNNIRNTNQAQKPDYKEWFNKIELSQNIQELQSVFEEGQKIIKAAKDNIALNNFIKAKEAKKQYFLKPTDDYGNVF